jgi:hypothetical protein
MEPQILFEEKQYLGFNTYSMSRRMVLAIFCFVAYYYTEDRERNADLLFLVGIFILAVSVLLLFVKYLHIKVTENSIIIKGMWSTRLVKIDLSAIEKVEKTVYSNYHLNSPAFNLHVANTIKFYSGGKDAIKLTDKEGLTYLIGTTRADEFLRAVTAALNKN